MYPGNAIDPNLTLNEYFEKKYKKASDRMQLLTNVRPYWNQASVFDILNMMIVPLLTCCSIIYFNCTLTNKGLISSIEKRADIIINRNHENSIH